MSVTGSLLGSILLLAWSLVLTLESNRNGSNLGFVTTSKRNGSLIGSFVGSWLILIVLLNGC